MGLKEYALAKLGETKVGKGFKAVGAIGTGSRDIWNASIGKSDNCDHCNAAVKKGFGVMDEGGNVFTLCGKCQFKTPKEVKQAKAKRHRELIQAQRHQRLKAKGK